jgi:hypothetical protein
MQAMRLVIAVALAFSTVASAKAPAREVPGTLVINAVTPGAEVFVDGEKIGETPLTGPVPMQAGEHTIKVQKTGFAPLIDVFKITRKGQTKVDVELQPIAGALKVSSSIEKARVFVDGKFVCEAPCSTEMSPGARAVQVSKGGYKDFFQNVMSVAGQEVALDVKLEELPMGINPYKPPPPPPPKWYEKWWVWTAAVAGAGVIAVVIAVPVTQSQRDLVAEFKPQYTFSIGAAH